MVEDQFFYLEEFIWTFMQDPREEKDIGHEKCRNTLNLYICGTRRNILY